MIQPLKPFDTYKWRWLSVQPTESLLQPPIFLGVLRALEKCEGLAFSDNYVREALLIVEQETKSPVTLARIPERNLFRNSGQYWRGTGLIKAERGKIELTSLGHKVASGKVTQGEFAAIMVQQTVLPNLQTYSAQEIKKWQQTDLEIRPLLLLLQILQELGEINGKDEAYITPNELIQIIIPLAGAKHEYKVIADCLIKHRKGSLNIRTWPDCAPEANDKRLAREFLLFLSDYGICRLKPEASSYDYKFYLDELFDVGVVSNLTNASIFSSDIESDEVIKALRQSALPSFIERQRTFINVLSRPNQAKFRKSILNAFNNRCLLSGESISEILEAAHIIPVTRGGSDERDNGLCLRIDIHRLFDSGNIRLKPDGSLKYSETLMKSPNYSILPKEIQIPPFVRMAHIEWRDKYL